MMVYLSLILRQGHVMDARESEASGIVFSKEVPPQKDKLHGHIAAASQKVTEEQLAEIYRRTVHLYELKDNVSLCEIKAISEEILHAPQKGWTLVGIKTTFGSNVVPGATVALRDPSGKVIIAESVGDSSTEAVWLAIQKATGLHVFLHDFTYGNITSGSSALGRASVQIEHHGRMVNSHAYSVDIIEAGAKAFLYAVNKVLEQIKHQSR
ncbi:MAG: alpha-isopropylmalate synthase regulatory domain-containing protein [Planctomycetota bacterium]